MALLVPVAARADPPAAPPSEAQVEAARALYHDARELHKEGRLKEAVDKGLEAYRTAATPITALEAGELLVEAGRLVQARDMVRGVAMIPVSPRESDKGRDARQQAAALAGQLDMRIPKIALADRPRGVEVLLDGRPLALADATAWQGVDPGPHALLVRVDERPCTTISLPLGEGEERTIDLHDVASACRPAPAPSPAPAPAPPAASGPTQVLPPPGQGGSVDGPWRWVGAAIAGAGAVAVGVGGTLALSAKSDYDSVAPECPARGCNQDGYDVRQRARSRADVATVTMGLGAAALLGGALVWWLGPGAGRASVGVGAGDVSLRWTF
jgi:hypothetical protein